MRFTIALNNQAAIQTIRKEKNDIRTLSGQCAAPTSRRHHKLQTRQKHHLEMGPRHEGVAGNERADKEAKVAAGGDTSKERYIPIEC